VRRKLALNGEINKRVRIIFTLLRERRSARALGQFVRGEHVWLTYRDAVCKSRAAVYEGGTASGPVLVDCQVRLNAAHLKELGAFLNDLGH
jgi:uncharacterized protein YecT (DUF1311 family)